MTSEEIRQTIIDELTIELQNEQNFDASLLAVKVSSALREVKSARRYPSNYAETLINSDLERYMSQIKAIALYDYTKIGAEGQTNYSADGENISYVDRNSLFVGISPVCTVV